MGSYSETYQRRKENGICAYCGKASATSGMLCHNCRCLARKRSAENKRRHRIKRLETGECVNCHRPVVPGKKKCTICLDHNKKARNKRTQEADQGGRCRRCDSPAMPGFKVCETHREIERQFSINRRQERKQRVILAYGGKCACCGLDHVSALTIDHINGGGRQHIKLINTDFYIWLEKNNYPDGYQVLCANCNFSKYFGKGKCTIPH